jgi:hypothetical protein
LQFHSGYQHVSGTHFLYLQNEAVGPSQISVVTRLWNHAVS